MSIGSTTRTKPRRGKRRTARTDRRVARREVVAPLAEAPIFRLPIMRNVADPFENGESLTQPEFHRRYADYPDDVKAELIGGIVYMASPLSLPHSWYDGKLGFL